MSKARCGCLDEATHHLVSLLKLTTSAKDDDGNHGDFPIFSERVLYEALGKGTARSVMACIQKLALACGIENINNPDPNNDKEVHDEKEKFWALDRAIGEASEAMHRLRYMFHNLDRAHDFSELMTSRRHEIESLFRDAKYHSPDYMVDRLRRLLSIDDAGHIKPKGEREKDAKKTKKTKKKASRKAK